MQVKITVQRAVSNVMAGCSENSLEATFSLMNSLSSKVWSQACRLRNLILQSPWKVSLSPLRGKSALIKFMETECLFIII